MVNMRPKPQRARQEPRFDVSDAVKFNESPQYTLLCIQRSGCPASRCAAAQMTISLIGIVHKDSMAEGALKLGTKTFVGGSAACLSADRSHCHLACSLEGTLHFPCKCGQRRGFESYVARQDTFT